jgi:dynein heavy chain
MHLLLMIAIAAGPANVPARAATIAEDGSVSWSYCLVQQYKADTGLYLVHFDQRSAAAAAAAAAATGAAAGGEGEAGRVVASSSSAAPPQQSAWLPRVHICFLAEDPALYAQRFVAAHAGADAAQQLLRYQLICDTMPVDDVPQLPPEQVQRVMSSALNSKRLRDQFLDASGLVTAANLDHQRALNRATLDDVIRRPDADRGAQLLPLPPVPPDQLQEGIWAAKRRKVGARGTVEMPPEFNFAEQYSEFSFRTLLTKVEVIQTLSKIRSECAKVSLQLDATYNLHCEHPSLGALCTGVCDAMTTAAAGRSCTPAASIYSKRLLIREVVYAVCLADPDHPLAPRSSRRCACSARTAARVCA